MVLSSDFGLVVIIICCFAFLIFAFFPVKNVMLKNEENIEENWEEADAEFGHVAENRTPIVVIVRLQCNE